MKTPLPRNRSIFASAVILLAFAPFTHAAVSMRSVEYRDGDTVLEGFVAFDESASGSRPGVLVVHDWMGVAEYAKMRTEQLAGLGYVAFCADIYGKGVRPKDVTEASAQAGKYKADRALLRRRANAGLAELMKNKLVQPGKVAAIGYCFGGTAVIELARSGAGIAGVVSFHGGLDSPNPADGQNIRAKVLALHGADDPYVKPADLAAFQDEMRQAKVDWQMVSYGDAVHSFTNKGAGAEVNLPPLTEKDIADVALGAELGVDLVALSFCREASDIDTLRELLRQNGSAARIVAKIEDQLAVRNLNSIIDTTDVVMVARGDLGIECPMEELPIIQRKIVKRCLMKGVPVIVATNMLESMILNPVPTRAEITDVANAVFEQADAVMLSGETTVGKYPVECVKVLTRVAERIERSGGAGYASSAILEDDRQKTVHSAVELANSLPDAKLVVFTRRGNMANYVSNLRPRVAPIYAFAPTFEVCRRLSINWGTFPHYLSLDANPNRTIGAAINLLVERQLVKSGEHLVIVSDILAGEERFDSIQLRVVP